MTVFGLSAEILAQIRRDRESALSNFSPPRPLSGQLCSPKAGHFVLIGIGARQGGVTYCAPTQWEVYVGCAWGAGRLATLRQDGTYFLVVSNQ